MDTNTITMYTKILMSGKTLKCDVADAIEVIKQSADLAGYNSQQGKNIVTSLEDAKDFVKGKIIIKNYLINNRTTKILYWSCCDIDDFIALAGFSDYSNGVYNKVRKVFRDDRISFLGRDIVTALKNVPEDAENKFVKDMKNNYLNSEHPLLDRIFYNINFNFKTQKISCYRNLDLSPRPVKKDNEENK